MVIIPAYNEQDSIGLVLERIPKERIIEIIVVNNNSSDNTKEVAEDRGAKVIDEPKLGYGRACLTGIQKAYEYNPEVIAFLDGDFSDDPEDLPSLLAQIDAGFELVIGSRLLGRAEPKALLPQARFGNWLATSLMKVLFSGPTFTDLGPFRAISTSALKKIDMKDQDFGWTVEMQVKALAYQLKCTEVSVHYKKRIGVSKITGTIKGTILAGYKILGTIGYLYFKYLIKSPIKSQPKAQ